MKKTAKIHTALMGAATVIFTIAGIFLAHDWRGYWAIGGEYLIPMLGLMLWWTDMRYLGRLSRMVKRHA